MSVRRQHYVVFNSPGTIFAEQSRYKVDEWDPAKAVKLSKKVKERYGATPYSFNFVTVIEADPIPDGEGGTLEVMSKEVAWSNRYWIGGKILSYADIKERNKKEDEILRDNMRFNDWAYVVENTNSYKVVIQLEEKDCIVDDSGKVIARGDDKELMKYRRQFKKECKEYLDSLSGKSNAKRR